MSKNIVDKETKRILEQGELLKSLVENEGWGLAKDMLIDRVMDLQSVRNITGTTSDEIAIDVKARATAVDYLTGWLREVEGTVEQHKANKSLIPEPDHILRI